MSRRRKFLGETIVLDFNGVIRKAKVIDIEFQTGIGPLFLMKTAYGNTFWLTRGEIADHEVNKVG